MNHDHAHEGALPPARSLTNNAQIRVIALVVTAIVLVVLGIWGLRALMATPPETPKPLPAGAFRATPDQLKQLAILPVRYGELGDVVRASGSITADGNTTTPVLLPFGGQITRVMVETGQSVAQGQPLFEIASTDIVDAQNTLTSALAQKQAATQALSLAQQNAVRQKAIYETAGGALKDYSQAQNDLVAAQAQLRTAQSAVQAAQGKVAILGSQRGRTAGGAPTTVYRAPVAGMIAERNIAPGQFIASGGSSAVLTITNPARVWLVAQLAESDVATVQVGDQVAVTTPALPGRSFSAHIDNVGAGLDPVTHRLPVRASIDNVGGALKPQMFASFIIHRRTSTAEGILVPAAAVIYEGDNARVWVQGRDALLYARPVQTGGTEGGMTKILRGLQPGDRIVSAGALFVNEAGLHQ